MITPLAQTLMQGVVLLIIAPLVPIVVHALRRLMTQQPVGNLGAEVKAWGRELTMRDEPSGSWVARFVPMLVFALSLSVIVMDTSPDVFVLASLVTAALAALALGKKGGYARVGLATTALFLGLGAHEITQTDVLPLVLTVVMCVVLGSEFVRETAGTYRGFSRAVIVTAFGAFALVLGLLAAQMILPTSEPGLLIVQVITSLVAFAFVQEATDRAAFTRVDAYILAALLGLLSFIAAVVLQIV